MPLAANAADVVAVVPAPPGLPLFNGYLRPRRGSQAHMAYIIGGPQADDAAKLEAVVADAPGLLLGEGPLPSRRPRRPSNTLAAATVERGHEFAVRGDVDDLDAVRTPNSASKQLAALQQAAAGCAAGRPQHHSAAWTIC